MYPSQINIETIHGCNARCTFCHVNLWERPKGHMENKVFFTIIDQLKDWAPDHLKQTSLILNGEPLLDPKIADRIYECKNAKLPNVGITTNGYLMNEMWAEKIIKSNPDYIVFSFDTLNKKDYEDNRLRLKFDKVKDNIVNFIEKRNNEKSNIRIVVRHIDFHKNIDDFEHYLLFF